MKLKPGSVVFYTIWTGNKAGLIYSFKDPHATQWCSHLSGCSYSTNHDWLTELGLTSHQTHYRSYCARGFYGSNDPNTCQSTEGTDKTKL